MTLADQLAAAIRSGDGDACVRLLHGASEAERAAAAPDVHALFVASLISPISVGSAEKASRIYAAVGVKPCGIEPWFRIRQAAQIANLGTTLDVDDLAKSGWECVPAKLIVAVLRERKPPFPEEWPELLRAKLHWFVDWHVLRALVREGLSSAPLSDEYVLGMIWTADHLERAYDGYTRDGDPDPTPLFDDDPALLDHDVWRVFEVLGNRQVSLTTCRSFWHDGLLELAASGRLDRARMLDATLAALASDTPRQRAGFFARLLDGLAATPAEIEQRQDAYFGLLESALSPTVKVATRGLALLAKERKLDVPRFLATPDALSTPRCLAALAIVKILGGVRGKPRGAAVSAAVAFLEHESVEVVDTVLDVLESAPSSPALVARVASMTPASRKARVSAWLTAHGGSPLEPASSGHESRRLER